MMTAPNILVIEDDTLLNKFLVQNLQKMGYQAQGVSHLTATRDFLKSNEPSLILLDGHLPDGNGMDLLLENSFTCRISHCLWLGARSGTSDQGGCCRIFSQTH
ncbi:MAG: response regulator [Thiotrichaceae bacterium]